MNAVSEVEAKWRWRSVEAEVYVIVAPVITGVWHECGGLCDALHLEV